MKRSYKAILEGDTLKWTGARPRTGCPTEVEVSIDETDDRKGPPNGAAVAALLRQIAARGGIPGIDDPAAWEREIRKDRPLPGRGS